MTYVIIFETKLSLARPNQTSHWQYKEKQRKTSIQKGVFENDHSFKQ